jgi:hypothetical protein
MLLISNGSQSSLDVYLFDEGLEFSHFWTDELTLSTAASARVT